MRAGIVGCGNVAWKYSKIFSTENAGTHYHTLAHDEGTKLVSVFDTDIEAIDEMKKFVAAPLMKCASLREFMSCDLDVVSVCVNNSNHFETVLFLLENGIKYIWLEKPGFLSKTEHSFIKKVANKNSARIQVNYQRLFDENIDSLIKMLHDQQEIFISAKFCPGLDRNGVHLLSLITKLLSLSPSLIDELEIARGSNQWIIKSQNIQIFINELPFQYHVLECDIFTREFMIRFYDKCQQFKIKRLDELGGGFTDLKNYKNVRLKPTHDLFKKAYRNLISNDDLISPPSIDALYYRLGHATL